ncbi:MAG: tRNA (adenosine(37)-N6)-dimethylallyltransferase MiaA [Verrucomicrobiota bacterium]
MGIPIRLLAGPTAAGKSAIALDWARQTGGWILSCDALLFYRGADIGTAKPTAEERREISHFGIDLCEPDQVFNLSLYIDYAKSILARAVEQDRPILVTGGSGFYLTAYSDPAPDNVDIPESIRREVETIASNGGIEGLRNRLLAVDPKPTIDLNNPRRIAPALERCLATDLTTAELKKRHQDSPCAFEEFDRRWYLVDPGEVELQSRIEARTRQMLEAGLIDEVRELVNRGLRKNPTLSNAIGYRETLSFLEAPTNPADLGKSITENTIRLSKRQRRWIRNRLPETKVIESGDEIL